MKIVDYQPSMGLPLVQMWRESFERSVGVKDTHSFAQQIEYLHNSVLPKNTLRIVLDDDSDEIIGFLASNAETIDQLYVNVNHQGRGIGTALLDLAKKDSAGRLRLFTFDSNSGAQRFYEKHGFKIIARGFEQIWQLKDIEYEWIAE